MNALRQTDSTAESQDSADDGCSSGQSRWRDGERQLSIDIARRSDQKEKKLDFEIVHSVPGRLRLRVRSFRNDFKQASACLDALADLKGFKSVRNIFWCRSTIIEYDRKIIDETSLIAAIKNLSYGPHTNLRNVSSVRIMQEPWLMRWLKRFILTLDQALPLGMQLAIGAASFVLPLVGAPASVSACFLSASTAPIFARALHTLAIKRKLGIDALDSAAASLMIANGRFVEAGFMTCLIALGEVIRAKTARRCQELVTDLLGLTGRSAWLMRGNKRICVAADEVKSGDMVVVYPGDMVPVDGVVIEGLASIDQSKLTGESMPVEVDAGHKVYASTVAVEGKIYVRCEAAGADTRAGIVLRTVASAPIHETKIHNYASSIAEKAVMPIFLASGFCYLFTRDISRMMSMLILDFCTGIRIAAPTAILSSMHRAGRHGILIKNGAALERLANVSAIVFDKTGTLTSGEPKVEEVARFNGRTEDQVLALAAAVEMRLHHPAARAIVKAAQQKGLNIRERSESEFLRGLGAKARVGDNLVLVGSKSMMEAEGIEIDETRESELKARKLGESISFVAVDGKVAGVIRYADRLRSETKQAIIELKRLGVKKLVMATGDTTEAASRIAEACEISEVIAKAFPEDKAELVKKLKSEGHTVAVIGDGINDSPALAYADVAISLHGATDAARHSAHVVLTDDNLARLPEAIRIARAAMQLVKQNLALAIIPNVAGFGMAGIGMLGPAGATLLNNGSAIGAAVNSLRPLYSDGWSTEEPLSTTATQS